MAGSEERFFKGFFSSRGPQLQPPTSCPRCNSKRVWKDGFRKTMHGRVQRYLCRDCGCRFSKNHNNKVKHTFSRRVCAYEVKNSAPQTVGRLLLEKVEGKKQPAGGTADSQLFNFAWWMKKNGYADATIESRVKVLRVLVKRGADLRDPESIKEALARQKWSSVRREIAIHAYSLYLKYAGGTWSPPICRREEKLPFIPYEQDVDALISGCSAPISAFLQLLKETAIRCGEAYRLSWEDVDFQRGTVSIRPEKGSSPRVFNVSDRLLNILASLKRDRKGGLFGYGSLRNLRRTFERQRKRTARKLGNPRINRITFHTLRHWKATMLYHKTKDVLYVMRFLGHKNIKNTLRYVQLEEALFKRENEEFICKTAETIEEARELIESGFEYVTEMNGVKLFRRRK